MLRLDGANKENRLTDAYSLVHGDRVLKTILSLPSC
jgi:hypothetical protein